jgi:hypothetical protein
MSSFDDGRVISRSRVPELRSRSIAIEVIRNMITRGKMPTSGRPIRSKVSSPTTYLISVMSRQGMTMIIPRVR